VVQGEKFVGFRLSQGAVPPQVSVNLQTFRLINNRANVGSARVERYYFFRLRLMQLSVWRLLCTVGARLRTKCGIKKSLRMVENGARTVS
jgi:hypothetical protein